MTMPAAAILDFTGRAVIVTGAARGIGAACARAFAQAGAGVVIADIDEAGAIAQAQRIAAETGADCRPIACNVASDTDCARLVAQAVDAFGRIDALVNNAAITAPGGILDLDPADWDRAMDVNLRSVFILTQMVARRMIEADGNAGARRRGGAIVNVSSVNAVLSIPNQLAYVASKGGLNQLTKTAALGLAPYGVRVNAVGPGSIMTELLQTVMTDAAARERVLARTPMGRLGEPDEIAQIVLFLASDMASYITGQTVYADGGRLALNYTVPVSASDATKEPPADD